MSTRYERYRQRMRGVQKDRLQAHLSITESPPATSGSHMVGSWPAIVVEAHDEQAGLKYYKVLPAHSWQTWRGYGLSTRDRSSLNWPRIEQYSGAIKELRLEQAGNELVFTERSAGLNIEGRGCQCLAVISLGLPTIPVFTGVTAEGSQFNFDLLTWFNWTRILPACILGKDLKEYESEHSGNTCAVPSIHERRPSEVKIEKTAAFMTAVPVHGTASSLKHHLPNRETRRQD
ncbi:hypothetical protein B0H14DRAFT_2591713 [Mycena olivaceomarginata]|nr:hypothetical protein B0H14DRAFT_2591713 [Mycena olivaceomarginata]